MIVLREVDGVMSCIVIDPGYCDPCFINHSRRYEVWLRRSERFVLKEQKSGFILDLKLPKRLLFSIPLSNRHFPKGWIPTRPIIVALNLILCAAMVGWNLATISIVFPQTDGAGGRLAYNFQ